jgi:insertion element IS1 protein InsB
MWSYVGKKAHQHWLWHAIDHHTGKVLAYGFGRRQDEVFLRLKALLEPFGITRYYTDGWGTYMRHLDPAKHTIGKQHMQTIESKHINLRTRIKRLVRRTLCFSKTERMHEVDGRMSAPVLAWGSAEEALRLSLAVPGWRGPCPVRRGKASDV